jgi:hypothetical protein
MLSNDIACDSNPTLPVSTLGTPTKQKPATAFQNGANSISEDLQVPTYRDMMVRNSEKKNGTSIHLSRNYILSMPHLPPQISATPALHFFQFLSILDECKLFHNDPNRFDRASAFSKTNSRITHFWERL